MEITEKNTKLFYKELKNNCDPEKLLNIAKQGIFLYEPLFKYEKIKYHEKVVDISFLSYQYFMIYNKEQYNRFNMILEKYHNKKLYTNNYYYLAIMNEFFIKQLLQEKNETYIENVMKTFGNNFLLKFLFKFKFITLETYNLFNNEEYYDKYEFFNFFYYNENGYFFNNKKEEFILDKEATMVYLIINYGFDINMLKYASKRLKMFKKKIPIEFCSIYRVPLYFPLKVLEYFTKKFYEANNYVVVHENKIFERFINAIFSDDLFCQWYNENKNIDKKNYPQCINNIADEIFERYGTILNIKEKINIEYKKHKSLIIDNNYISNTINGAICDCFPGFRKIKISKFKKVILDDFNKIELLLNRPEFLFEQNEDFTNCCIKFNIDNLLEYNLIIISYIVSLIHNNYSNFLIHLFITFIYDKKIKFENNKFVYYHREEYDFEESELYTILSNTPNKTFNQYFEKKVIPIMP